jgi:hypothetical protein
MPWWPDIPNVSEYTRPATWEDVKNLARLLNDAGVQYALVGGYETIDLDGTPLPLLNLEGLLLTKQRRATERPASPDMTRTLDLAMPSLSAMKATNAAFAAPSTGGAARRIRIRPSCTPAISVLLARG